MAIIREFGERSDELDNNVIDLDQRRALKAQPVTEELDQQAEPSNVECADGVCVAKWHPRRTAA